MGIASRSSALAIGYCFPIIGGALVALRFYMRHYQKALKRIDDWLCLPAWLCVTGCCASLLTGVYKNAFVDQTTIAPPGTVTEQQKILAQITAALVIFWISSNALIKLSILFFYRRIFVGRKFNISNWILISLSLFWLIYAFLSWMLYCGTNIHANFEGGWSSCDPWGFDIQMGVFCLDSFIDLCLLILPIPFVWRLQLNLSRKTIIGIIFLLGGFAFVAGLNNTVIQLVYLTEPSVAESQDSANYFQGSDLLFSTWPAVEVGVGLIACNLPSLSFRAAHAIPAVLRRGWNISLSGVIHAAERLTLRSEPRDKFPASQHADPPAKTGKEGPLTLRAKIEGYGSLQSLSHKRSAPTISNVPLAHLAPKASTDSQSTHVGYNGNKWSLEPAGSTEEDTPEGFNAV